MGMIIQKKFKVFIPMCALNVVKGMKLYMEKFKQILIYLLLIIFGLAIARHFIETPIIAIVFIGIIAFIAYKLDLPKFGLWLFLISFLIRIVVIVLFDTPIDSDYIVMYNTAKEIISGNLNVASTIGEGYMLRWGYQMGYTLFMVLLMLISNGPFLIKLVNCLFTALIVVFIYFIAKEITNKKVARVVSVLYMFFPFPLFFNTLLSNQHISSFLFLLAIFIFMSKKTENMNYKLKYFLIGLCLAIGNIIRPEAIIFITSIFLYLILMTKRIDIKLFLKKSLILFLTYLCVTISASTIATVSGISPSGFGNKEPLWKFTVGFNPETNGDYNIDLAGQFIGETRKNQFKILYDYTIGSIEKLPALFLYKEQHFWLDSDLNTSLSYLTDKNISIFGFDVEFNEIRKILNSINQVYIYLFFGLTVFAIFLNRKRMPNSQFLFVIILLVYSGVYFLIECTPRYAYTAQIFLALMSSYSIEYFLNTKSKRQNIINQKVSAKKKNTIASKKKVLN